MSAEFHEARSAIKLSPDAPKLSIGLPLRKTSPIEFWLSMFVVMPPLNVRMSYIVQKAAQPNVKDGQLPAAARNAIIERALEVGSEYILLLDDDIIFPDITFYRLWTLIQKHPEIACITAIYGTKLTPTEPLLYKDTGSGAYWDWPLGALLPIESAGAGCMIVNMEYVKKCKAPWFNDLVQDLPGRDPDVSVRRHSWGHDRYFHIKLQEEAGGKVYADTGLLLGHFDVDLQKTYILPPDSPCFQRPSVGEHFVPFFTDSGALMWRRVYFNNEPDKQFKGYLDWLGSTRQVGPEMKLIEDHKEQNDAMKEWLDRVALPKSIEKHEGFTVEDSRRRAE